MTFLAVPASASALSPSTYDDAQTENGSAYKYDVATGETTYLPPEETETYSDETEGFSPGYNPNANTDNDNDSLIEPYYYDHGRILVENPQDKGMSCNTVHIIATYKDFKGETQTIEGTGFMIGPNAVATAAHILYQRQTIGNFFVGNATIIPANNIGSNPKPFGTANAKYFYCGSGWANNGDFSDDWGIIELDSNIGNKTGWLGLRWQSAPYENELAYINGYPEKVNGNNNLSSATRDRNLYYRHGKVNTSSQTNTLESTDMYTSDGDSGGPCYIYSSETGYTAISIHSRNSKYTNDNSGNIICSKSRTIDKALFERMVEYRTSTL